MKKILQHFTDLWGNVSSNIVFILEFVLVITVIFLAAWQTERCIRMKTKDTEKILSTRKIAVTGVMAAIAGVLMLFELPLFFAPSFYKLDFSELPVLICGFAFGPVAGVLCEAVKIIVKLLLKGTSTAFVGELANFVVGCFFVLPATMVYYAKKSKKTALMGCIAGTLTMTVAGTLFNGIYLLPKFAQLFGMPLDALIAMGTKVNSKVNSVTSLVMMCVAPLNLIKGFAVSLVTMLIYHPLRPLFKKNI